MVPKDKNALYKKCYELWGYSQYVCLMEECAELQKEASKFYRGKGDLSSLAEEIADVEIMIEQMMVIHGEEFIAEVVVWKHRKLKRLKKLVKTTK